MSELTFREAFEVYRKRGAPLFRGLPQAPATGMTQVAFKKMCIDSKLFKGKMAVANCMIVFQQATQGNRILDFEQMEEACSLMSVKLPGNLTPSDVKAYITHTASKFLDAVAGKNNQALKTKEDMKKVYRENIQAGKEKVVAIPPQPIKKKGNVRKKKPPMAPIAPAATEDTSASAKVDDNEKEPATTADKGDQKVVSSSGAKGKSTEDEEKKDSDEPDLAEIARLNKIRDENKRVLKELNAQLKSKQTATEKQCNSTGFSWDAHEPSILKHRDNPSHWDFHK